MSNMTFRARKIIASVIVAVFAFSLEARADETMPVLITSEIDSSDDGKGVILEETLYFNALPPVSISAGPCVTSSGCMSSEHPKYDCYANRWVIGMSGGMPSIQIPSPHPQARALFVQVQGMRNVLRKSQGDFQGTFDATQYNVQTQKWETEKQEQFSFFSRISAQMLNITSNLNQSTVGIINALGKSGYVDSDGGVCGPGVDEISGDELKRSLANLADSVNRLTDQVQVRVIWELPRDFEMVPHESTHVVQQRNIEVNGTPLPVSPPITEKEKSLHGEYRREIETIARSSGASREEENAVAGGVRFAGDMYGFALAARQGKEDAARFFEEWKAKKKEAAKQGSLPRRARMALKALFGRTAHAAEPDTPIRWSQAPQMLQSASTIPFKETNALAAIRQMRSDRLPVFVGYLDQASDPAIVHAVVLLDYDSTGDKFTAFAGNRIVSLSWDALMRGQPRFLIGVPPAEGN